GPKQDSISQMRCQTSTFHSQTLSIVQRFELAHLWNHTGIDGIEVFGILHVPLQTLFKLYGCNVVMFENGTVKHSQGIKVALYISFGAVRVQRHAVGFSQV